MGEAKVNEGAWRQHRPKSSSIGEADYDEELSKMGWLKSGARRFLYCTASRRVRIN